MVRHSSDESEAPEMTGDYSKAIEKRCALRWQEMYEKMYESMHFHFVPSIFVSFLII